jgi:hypothetical protein
MAFTTSAWEYLIGLAVFLSLFIVVIFLMLTKTYKEKGLYWGTYHNLFSILLVFLASRLLVLSLLLYIHLGPLSQLQGMGAGSPNYTSLNNQVNILRILWEFVFLIGLNLLFTLISYATLIWKRMTERASSGDYPFLFIVNVILYFVAFAALVVQFIVALDTLTWINVAYLVYGVYSLGGAFILVYSVNRVQYLIRSSDSSGAMSTLKRKLDNIQLLGWLTGLLYGFRGFIIILDTFVYPFITMGVPQTIWNIIFKYVCWVVPEFLIVVFLVWAYLDTDAFITELAVISIEYEQGRHSRIDELNQKESNIPVGAAAAAAVGGETQIELTNFDEGNDDRTMRNSYSVNREDAASRSGKIQIVEESVYNSK